MRDDHVDIGVLVAWALRPNQRPGRSPEYQRVLDRYRTVGEFRAAADAVLHGLGAEVLSDGDFGLVLGVTPESPLAFRVTDMPNLYKSDHRVLAGLILTGLAAFAYPSAQELDEDRLRPVEVAEFDAWLRDLCERLRSHDAGGEVIPEEGLDAAWRIYLTMPSLDLTPGTSQPSIKCTPARPLLRGPGPSRTADRGQRSPPGGPGRPPAGAPRDRVLPVPAGRPPPLAAARRQQPRRPVRLRGCLRLAAVGASSPGRGTSGIRREDSTGAPRPPGAPARPDLDNRVGLLSAINKDRCLFSQDLNSPIP
jgi:hypothetical protein